MSLIAPRFAAIRSRKATSLLALGIGLWVAGCKEPKPAPAVVPSTNNIASASLFEIATKEYHMPAAAKEGAERERLQNLAAERYREIVQRFPHESNVCAQALRSLGNIRAAQTNVDAAVKAYAEVGDKFPTQRWEVLQAWKSAADLLWDANRRGEAGQFYQRIIERYGGADESEVIRTVVKGSRSRLAEKKSQ